MARIAHGQRENVGAAIESGAIPLDSLIVTKDKFDSEILFYNRDGELLSVTERTRFETLTEAEQWAKKYPSVGLIFTIQNGSEWLPYIVQSDNTLTPFKGEIGEITDIKRIDGGTSVGI